MKMTYSMRQQHALIKMNAIFKFACHKDVAQPKAMKSSPLLEPFCGSEFWGFSLLKI